MINEFHDKWHLDADGGNGERWVTPITGDIFRIGRKDDCDLCLPSDSISRLHAEIRVTTAGLSIRDCSSTNGTFVNFHRIADEHPLKSGDVVHFATHEFRVVKSEGIADRTIMVNPYVEQLDELIKNQAVVPHFQPIVGLADPRVFGYELLGRIQGNDMPGNIPQLFHIAKQLGRERELSLVFRNAGIAKAVSEGVKGLIFFNTVPGDMGTEALVDSLAELRSMAPDLDLAMEIHENAITDIGMISRLRDTIDPLSIKLVYDDFGAGQSRLQELMDAPPDVLKFDISLIRNIHLRPSASSKIVESLVQMAKELQVVTLAEGIELPEEAEFCRNIGFDLAQGYLFGKPTPNLGSVTLADGA